MNCLRTFMLFFSIAFVSASAQQKDSLQVEKKYQPNFMVGGDLLNVGISFFSDRKVYQGFISTHLKKDLHLIAELGYEDNLYDKNGYEAYAKGAYLKAGGFYMLMKDTENQFNGFYAGPKLAASMYEQHYVKVPVRGSQGGDSFVGFDPSNQTSVWIEGSIGGRVQLFKSAFYIDVNVQPRYLVYTTKQEEITPMIVPGFGKSSSNFNLGFAWNLAFKF